jgi:ribosomal protein S18
LLRKFISVEVKFCIAVYRFNSKEQRHIATAIKTARVGLLPFINQ